MKTISHNIDFQEYNHRKAYHWREFHTYDLVCEHGEVSFDQSIVRTKKMMTSPFLKNHSFVVSYDYGERSLTENARFVQCFEEIGKIHPIENLVLGVRFGFGTLEEAMLFSDQYLPLIKQFAANSLCTKEELNAILADVMICIESLLRLGISEHTKKPIKIKEAEQLLNPLVSDSNERMNALGWLLDIYQSIVKRERVTTIPEAFSYAKSLIDLEMGS